MVERYAQVGLPPGAVNGGEILQPEIVVAALKELRGKGKFKTNRVAVGIANQRVVVRQIDLPWMPAAEVRGALAYQVQDLLPIPVEDAVLDYHPIEEFVGEGGSRLVRAMLVAADAAMLERNIDVVRAGGLRPSVVDLTSFALLRTATLAVRAGLDPEEDVQHEAVIDVGANITNIIVHARGVPHFVRILTLGGDDVTEALGERLGISHEEAEAFKCSAGSWDSAEAAERETQGRRVLESGIGTLVEEILGSLDYYRSQGGAHPLSRILLSGGGALLAGLSEQLSLAVRMPVDHAPSMMSLPRQRSVTDVAAERADPFAVVAIGLALRMAA
jgi:type IV pilus assembly protein PilM